MSMSNIHQFIIPKCIIFHGVNTDYQDLKYKKLIEKIIKISIKFTPDLVIVFLKMVSQSAINLILVLKPNIGH